jgi:hypothetical protein
MLFVDKISWDGGPTGLAVKREVDVLVEPYLSMPMWAPCTREYERLFPFTKGWMFLIII